MYSGHRTIRLLFRLSLLEGWQPVTVFPDGFNQRIRLQITIKPLGVIHLWNQADVRQRNLLTKTDFAVTAAVPQALLQRGKADCNPVTVPLQLLFFRNTQILFADTSKPAGYSVDADQPQSAEPDYAPGLLPADRPAVTACRE